MTTGAASTSPQVQSIEFTQIEMKVVEGLQIGNECLKKMHQVGPGRAGGRREGSWANEGTGSCPRPHLCPGHGPGAAGASRERGKASATRRP